MKKTKTVSIRLVPVVIAAILIIALIIGTNSGKVTIWNGQFNVEKLAATLEVGSGNTYTSLQDAVDAAKSGDTIQLTESMTISDTVTIRNKNLTIDLNGNTVTSTTMHKAIANHGGELTIKKGNIVASDSLCILYNSEGKLNISSLNIENGSSYGIVNTLNNNSELIFNDKDVTITAGEPIVGVITGMFSPLYGIRIAENESNKNLKTATVVNYNISEEYTVICENIVYESISKAIEAIPENKEKEIKLVRDTTEDGLTIPADKNIKINLNEYTLNLKKKSSTTNEGTLTICGAGTLNNERICYY